MLIGLKGGCLEFLHDFWVLCHSELQIVKQDARKAIAMRLQRFSQNLLIYILLTTLRFCQFANVESVHDWTWL